MKTMQATLLLLIVCFLGCSSTHRLRPAHEADFASLNNRAFLKKVMVTFVDGRKIKVANLRMTSDSTYWNNPQIKQQPSPTYMAVATSQIKEVRFIRRGRGAVDGMGFGLPLGLIYGVSQAGEACANCLIPISAGEIVLGLGIFGAILGAPVGAIIGHRDIYIIEHEVATGTH